jgi:hypothetical protein
MLVAQFAQPGQMDAQQAEHDGDALMPPIVHAPDATQPGAHRVEPQQAPFPETLSWYLHHFDDQIHPGAELMTVQVSDKSRQFKVVGKVQGMAFNHLCQERWAGLCPSPSCCLQVPTCRQHISQVPIPTADTEALRLARMQAHAQQPLWRFTVAGLGHMDAFNVSFTSVTCVRLHSTKACSVRSACPI